MPAIADVTDTSNDSAVTAGEEGAAKEIDGGGGGDGDSNGGGDGEIAGAETLRMHCANGDVLLPREALRKTGAPAAAFSSSVMKATLKNTNP